MMGRSISAIGWSSRSLPTNARPAWSSHDLGLWPGLTVVDNVGYPLKIQKVARPDRRRRVAEALTALRIDSLAGRRPDQLSAAQRLRTALARALVTRPELLVLDEPLGTLEPRSREEFWDDLRRVHAEAGVTILVLTDDPVAGTRAGGSAGRDGPGPNHSGGYAAQSFTIGRSTSSWLVCWARPTCCKARLRATGRDQKGEVVVRTPLGRLIGQMIPGQTLQGTPVTISVRPETLLLGPTIPAGWNRFPATVERITFRGELRQIQARGPGDWPIAISAIQSQSQNVREGQSLTLSVAPEHVVVLPGKFAVARPA